MWTITNFVRNIALRVKWESRRVKKGHILLETTDSLSWMSSIIFLNFISALFPRSQHGRLRRFIFTLCHTPYRPRKMYTNHVRSSQLLAPKILEVFTTVKLTCRRVADAYGKHKSSTWTETQTSSYWENARKKNQPNQNEFHLLFGLGR